MGHYAGPIQRTLSDAQPCHTHSCALRVSNVPNEMPAYGMIPTYLVYSTPREGKGKGNRKARHGNRNTYRTAFAY